MNYIWQHKAVQIQVNKFHPSFANKKEKIVFLNTGIIAAVRRTHTWL
jgi:hypothetical protein